MHSDISGFFHVTWQAQYNKGLLYYDFSLQTEPLKSINKKNSLSSDTEQSSYKLFSM